MTNTLRISAIFMMLILFFSSCKTYYIPVDSFKQQLSAFDSTDLREVTTQGPLGKRVTYKTYPIDSIHAVDSKGNPVTIANSPAIEVWITDNTKKKSILYFDLIEFDGEYIIGRQSRIAPALKKKIPLSSVKIIEVQDGKKNFRYIHRTV